jgi:hypothetical protein
MNAPLPSARRALAALAVAASASVAAAFSVPTDPPVFTNPLDITNTFQPFVPGGVKVFQGKSDGEAEVVVDIYLTDTREFDLGGQPVECHILQETEFTGGAVSEISLNYFAQGDDGAVYYFGEVVDTYEGGVVTGHEGSWLVGGATLPSDPAETADADAPGLFMPANPEVGDTFKPENLLPVVDETDTVQDTDVSVKTKAGKLEGCIVVEETSSLDSDKETKWYAPDLGYVRVKAKGETLKLIAATFGPVVEP